MRRGGPGEEIPCLSESLLVAVTGYAYPVDKRRCAEVGFDLHFAKPVDFQMLEYSLWLIADSRRLQDQSRRLALQQRAAFTTFIGQGIDMANTLLNVVVTSRDAQVKARCLAKVQQTYIRLSDLTQKTRAMKI
jgi:hypothetical protein